MPRRGCNTGRDFAVFKLFVTLELGCPSAHPVPRRNHMTRTLVALALALSATSALAQDYNRQDLVRGLCQKNGCDEFTILAADRIRTTDEGTLFKTRLKTFHASYAGRQDRGEENGYVFCSPTRPAIMAEQNGQTMAFFLGGMTAGSLSMLKVEVSSTRTGAVSSSRPDGGRARKVDSTGLATSFLCSSFSSVQEKIRVVVRNITGTNKADVTTNYRLVVVQPFLHTALLSL